MDRQLGMVIFGVAALVLYGASILFKFMHFPGVPILRLAALGMFVLGGALWVYDWQKKNIARRDREARATGWEDLIDDESQNKTEE